MVVMLTSVMTGYQRCISKEKGVAREGRGKKTRNGRTDGRTDGRRDGRTKGRTVGGVEEGRTITRIRDHSSPSPLRS